MSVKQKIHDQHNFITTHPENKDSDPVDQFFEIRVGAPCPACSIGSIDYDGLLNLVCSQCGFTTAGCFT